MKSWTRRLIVVGFYLLSLGVVATVSAYLSRNLTGLGPVPERGSFGRRLEGTQDGDARRIRFFYATNRSTEPSNNAFEGDGLRISSNLSLGTFDARISSELVIRPWVWEDPELVSIAGRDDLPPDEAMRQLSAAVAASPHKSLLVIVWGFNERFHSAALKTAYTAFVLDINTPVLLFDWPGNQGQERAGYLRSRQMATDSGPALGTLLSRLVRESGAKRIWLAGSSLGCQTICAAFTTMVADPDLADVDQEIEHVVLSAPDVAAREFDEQFAWEINALARHLSAYIASNDRALLLSRFLNRSPRLGRPAVAQGVTSGPVDLQLHNAEDLLTLPDKGARNCTLIDVTPVNRTRNLHHFFTDSTEYFDDLYRRLLLPEQPLARCLYSVPNDRGSSLYILWDQ